MSNISNEVIDLCSVAHKEFIEKVIKIADENGINRNELVYKAVSVSYLMRNADYSEYDIKETEVV